MIGRTKAERNFLFERYVAPGPFGRDTGISSDALLRMAMRRDTSVPRGNYPSDRADLGRCERVFVAAPRHLRRRMRAELERFRTHVALRYPEESP